MAREAHELGMLIEVFDTRKPEDPDIVAMRVGVDGERIVDDHDIETRYCEIKNAIPTPNYLRIVGDDDFTDVEIRVHHKTLRALGWFRPEWQSVESAEPPIRSKENPKPYVLAVDAKGRQSVAYIFSKYDEGGYWWVSAKPIGTPTHWMPLPDPPEVKD